MLKPDRVGAPHSREVIRPHFGTPPAPTNVALSTMRSRTQHRVRLVLAGVVLALASACSANKPKPNQVFLMPAPDVYADGQIDPFTDNDPISRGVQPYILYATDRAPATADQKKFEFYSDQRGHVVRLGAAAIELGIDETITWEEARRISLLKNRADNYPLEISSVEEFGVLKESIRPFDSELDASDEPGQQFAAAINEQLATSHTKDVYIYVHGYKVNFENPVLVASELWHFLGYNGAFVAYSWPSTSKLLAYFADLEDAINSARSLRTLLIYIARHTDAENIHIVGYSAGTRLVTRAIADLGIYAFDMDREAIRDGLKLGNVLLVGSDVDRNVFAGYLLDGMLDIPDSLTVYQSAGDSALGMSRRAFGKSRVGQIVDVEFISEETRRYFDDNPEFRLIDVTDAEGATQGSGHGYFRSSPWVSSDVLMTLLYNLSPAERGLVRKENLPIWEFPPDYLERLRRSLATVNPRLATDDNSADQP